MRNEYRAMAIIGLIGLAELALVGFAFLPVPLKVMMIFLNGLPLGMIFGLILSYLEGRKQTEALSAALCASFIVSSGVVKSVGSWLIQEYQVSDFSMPMITGAIFFVPLLISVWVLQMTPPPDVEDRELRPCYLVDVMFLWAMRPLPSRFASEVPNACKVWARNRRRTVGIERWLGGVHCAALRLGGCQSW
jgi:hypothetical protein